jgi:hypothetical protein
LSKIAENCDHNIDPRPDMEKHLEFAKIQYFANLHKDSVLERI